MVLPLCSRGRRLKARKRMMKRRREGGFLGGAVPRVESELDFKTGSCRILSCISKAPLHLSVGGEAWEREWVHLLQECPQESRSSLVVFPVAPTSHECQGIYVCAHTLV